MIKQIILTVSAINFIIFLLIPMALFSESPNDQFINIQKKYIYNLYTDKKYFDCIAETRRLITYEDKSRMDDYMYFINACYFAGEQYKTVIFNLKELNIKDDKYALPYLFLLSHSYFITGHQTRSREILNKTDYAEIPEPYRDGLFTNRAEVLLRSYAYPELLSEIENAGKYMNFFNKYYAFGDFKKGIQQYAGSGIKSKWISVSLSALIPGAGQAYSGRIIDGLLSLAAVAGSAWGTYYYHNKKDRQLEITFAFFTGLFYCGNLYGAYNSASGANDNANLKFMNRTIKKYNLDYNPADYIQNGIFE